MGRPKLYDEPRVATAIRLPRSLRDELRAAAAARSMSVNSLVTLAISECLRTMPAPEVSTGRWDECGGESMARIRYMEER